MLYTIRCSIFLLVLTAGLTLAKEAPTIPMDVRDALLAGLKRIDDGNIEEWFSKSCHPEALCTSSNARKSLKRYNMPALKRIVGKCLHGTAKDTLKVTRVQDDGDIIKLFIQCDPKARPRPFTLKKHNDQWMFSKL